MKAEQFTDVLAGHGEGGGWHAGERLFKFVDTFAGDLVSVDEQGNSTRIHVDTVAAAWRPRSTGGSVVAVERGFAFVGGVDDGWGITLWSDADVRMNDGGCDPQGRFYCGSMTYDARTAGGVLWRLDPDRSVHRVLRKLTIPNGLVWSLDGHTAYHIDTPTGRIVGYDYDDGSGSFGSRRTIASVVGGAPDGMTIDAEGGLWVALWGGNAVHRYDSRGVLTEVVGVGARQVTSCAFGGSRLHRLLITTSREGIDDDPTAGALFMVEPGVVGVPVHEFAG